LRWMGQPPRIWQRFILGLLVLALAQCGPAPSAGTRHTLGLAILGESWALRGTQPVTLRHKAVSVESIYGFDEQGRKRVYVEGQDWLFSAGAIRRTKDSRIPDYSSYRYLAGADGRFAFSPTPRNPGLILSYQAYVDYRSTRPDRVVRALSQGPVPQRILCVGDSITAGAQTIGDQAYGDDRDSFCGLLRRHLGPGFLVQNSSVVGGVLETFRANLDAYLVDPPQTVVIGFGMNDHLAGNQGLDAFTRSLDEVVARLGEHHIRVILLGFFQQNRLWDREVPEQTVAYNSAIRSVAAGRGVPFLDVYEAFRDMATERDLVDHLTADFMHHPNNCGQRVYFSFLGPHFMAEATLAIGSGGYDP